MNAILETFLIVETRIAVAVMDVGDVSLELLLLADLETAQRMIVGIGSQFLALEVGWLFADGDHILLGAIQHRLEVLMVLGGERLGREDDLMFGIDQRLGVVALNDPVRGRHLDRFVVHRVALDLPAVTAALGFAILEEIIEPLHLELEAAFTLLLALEDKSRFFIRLGMFIHHAL